MIAPSRFHWLEQCRGRQRFRSHQPSPWEQWILRQSAMPPGRYPETMTTPALSPLGEDGARGRVRFSHLRMNHEADLIRQSIRTPRAAIAGILFSLLLMASIRVTTVGQLKLC